MANEKSFRRVPWSVVISCVYMMFGFLWILFSDRLLEKAVSDVETMTAVQTYKGWAYVLITGLLVFVLVRGMELKLGTYLDKLEEQNRELVTQMDQIRRSEERIRQLMKVLELKNEELESIMYATSHDLRTPLVNIQGFAGELKDSCERLLGCLESVEADKNAEVRDILDDEIPTALGFISTGTARIGSLLNSVQEVCRLGREELRLETLDMNEVLENINDNLKHLQNQKEAEIVIGDLPLCRGDRDQIEQVFTNLMENSLKYTDEGTKPRIVVSGRSEAECSVYTLEDNGVGIAEQYHKKIFELFHRLDPESSVDGEGIGLTIVRRIVSRHEGQVAVEPGEEKGTRFVIKLPSA